MSLNWLFYDCEILRCIGDVPGFECVESWNDHDKMGLACIATYSSWDNAYRIFEAPAFRKFEELVAESDRVIGFNSNSFDDRLCRANNLDIQTDYDLLSEIWVSAGLPPVYVKGITIGGYSLEMLSQANFKSGKSGSGELAPQLWQQGKREAVLSYCLTDVFLSVRILRLGWEGKLVDPVTLENLKLAPLS